MAVEHAQTHVGSDHSVKERANFFDECPRLVQGSEVP
jgi:hypothetical protein